MGELIGSHPWGEWLSSNQAIVALANIGGVIGLGMIIWSLGKKAWQFCQAVWSANIKVALRRSRLRRLQVVDWCAADLHFLVVHVGLRMVIAIVGFMMPVMDILQFTTPAAARLNLLGLRESHGAVMDTIAIILSRVYMMIAIIAVADIFFFLRAVRRRRVRILMRQRRRRAQQSGTPLA